MTRTFVAAVLFAVVFLAVVPANAQVPVIDVASIHRQVLAYAKQIYAIAQRAQQIQNQYQQLALQHQALEKLEEIPYRLGPAFEEFLEGNLEFLHELYPSEEFLVQALFYALEEPQREFDRTFPGWEPYTPGPFLFGTQAGLVEIEDPREFLAYQDLRVLQTLRQALQATRQDHLEIGRTISHLGRIKHESFGNVGHQQALEMQLALSAHGIEQQLLARKDANFRNDLLLATFASETNRRLQESRTEKELFDRAAGTIEERHGQAVPVHNGHGGRSGMPAWYRGVGQ